MKKTYYLILFLILLPALFVTGCSKAKVSPEYGAKFEMWKQKRVEKLTADNGWLTLTGLYWLQEGENSIGSEINNQVVLPSGKCPSYLGKLTLRDGTVTAELSPYAGVMLDGKKAGTSVILKDDSKGKPTVLTIGPVSFYVIKRGDKYGIRIKDKEHENLKHFAGIETFPPDTSWLIKAKFRAYDTLRKIAVPTVLGTIVEEPCPGILTFNINGRELQLEPIASSPKDKEFFIIFGDYTNGKETYGAGRFLAVPKPDENNMTVIDFNKAYNPPCAFTRYATCPIPPESNMLPVKITAGEKKYKGHH